MFSTLVLASMLATQQQTVVTETVVDHSILSASIDGKDDFNVGEPITMLVKVRDYDTKVLYNPKTEKVRAEVYVAGGVHRIVIDPHYRGTGGRPGKGLVSQDQIVVRELGWDGNREWFRYEIHIKVDPTGLPEVSTHMVAIEIQDTTLDEKNRDKPQHLAIGFTLHKE